MEIAEAIKKAIEYETRILDIYARSALEVADERGQKVLNMLADEEKGHVAYLEEKLHQWQDQGILRFDSLSSNLPAFDSKRAESDKVADQFSGKPLTRERQILERALQAEIETSKFYESLVSALTGDGRKMFARFLEIENEHLQLVQAELDFITQSGFWFDFPEIDMETI